MVGGEPVNPYLGQVGPRRARLFSLPAGLLDAPGGQGDDDGRR